MLLTPVTWSFIANVSYFQLVLCVISVGTDTNYPLSVVVKLPAKLVADKLFTLFNLKITSVLFT